MTLEASVERRASQEARILEKSVELSVRASLSTAARRLGRKGTQGFGEDAACGSRRDLDSRERRQRRREIVQRDMIRVLARATRRPMRMSGICAS